MTLEPTWFVQTPLDFEHKKWILLAYLQDIQKKFESQIISPYLMDLYSHLSNLEKWKSVRELILKKEVKGLDWERLTLIYDLPECSPEMEELDRIVDWAYPRLQQIQKMGRILWSEIEKNFIVRYHGLWLSPDREGSMLIETPILSHVYQYTISPIISNEQISLQKIESFFTKKISPQIFKNGWWIKTSSDSIEGTLEPIIKKNLISWIQKY